jgi:hypothetical protein
VTFVKNLTGSLWIVLLGHTRAPAGPRCRPRFWRPIAGELRSGADGGSKVFKNDYDPAPIIGLRANFRF